MTVTENLSLNKRFGSKSHTVDKKDILTDTLNTVTFDFSNKNWFFIDLNSRFQIFGVDIFAKCCISSFHSIFIELSDASPANSLYDKSKTAFCTYLTGKVIVNAYNTFLCKDELSIGQFLIINEEKLGTVSVKFSTIEIFGKKLANLGKRCLNILMYIDYIQSNN